MPIGLNLSTSPIPDLKDLIGADEVKKAELNKAFAAQAKAATQMLYAEGAIGDVDRNMFVPGMAKTFVAERLKEQQAMGGDYTDEQLTSMYNAAVTRLNHDIDKNLSVLAKSRPDRERYAAEFLAKDANVARLDEIQRSGLESGQGYKLSPTQAAAHAIRVGKLDEGEYGPMAKFLRMGQADLPKALEALQVESPSAFKKLQAELEEMRYTSELDEGWEWYETPFIPFYAAGKAFSGAVGATGKRLKQVAEDPMSLLSPSDVGDYIGDVAAATVEGVVRGFEGKPGAKTSLANVIRKDTAKLRKEIKPAAMKAVARRIKDPDDLGPLVGDDDVLQNEYEREFDRIYNERVGSIEGFLREDPVVAETLAEVFTPTPLGPVFKGIGAAGRAAKATRAGQKALGVLDDVANVRVVRKARELTQFAPYAGDAGEAAGEVKQARRIARAVQAETANTTRELLSQRNIMRKLAAKVEGGKNGAKRLVQGVIQGDPEATLKVVKGLGMNSDDYAKFDEAFEAFKNLEVETFDTVADLVQSNPRLAPHVGRIAEAAATSSNSVRKLTEELLLGDILKKGFDVVPSAAEYADDIKAVLEAGQGVRYLSVGRNEPVFKVALNAVSLSDEAAMAADRVLVPSWFANSVNQLNTLANIAPENLQGASAVLEKVLNYGKATNSVFSSLAVGTNPLRLVSELPSNALLYAGMNGVGALTDMPQIARYTLGYMGKLGKKAAGTAKISSKKWGKLKLDEDYIDDLMRQNGLFDAADRMDPALVQLGQGRITGAVRSVTDKASLGGNAVVRAQDNAFRKAAFIRALKASENPTDPQVIAAATQYVADTTVYLRDMAPAAEMIGSFVPFFSFTTQATKLGAQLMQRNPGLVMKLAAAQETLQEGRARTDRLSYGAPIDWSPFDSAMDRDSENIARRYDWSPTSYMLAGPEMAKEFLEGNFSEGARRYLGPGFNTIITALSGVDEMGRPISQDRSWIEFAQDTGLGLAAVSPWYKGTEAYLGIRDATLRAQEAGIEVEWSPDLLRWKLAFARATRGLGPLAMDFADEPGMGLIENLAGKPYEVNLERSEFFDAQEDLDALQNLNREDRRRMARPDLIERLAQ